MGLAGSGQRAIKTKARVPPCPKVAKAYKPIFSKSGCKSLTKYIVGHEELDHGNSDFHIDRVEVT